MSQEELAKVLDFTMGEKKRMTCAEFKVITEEVSSAIFLCVSRCARLIICYNRFSC